MPAGFDHGYLYIDGDLGGPCGFVQTGDDVTAACRRSAIFSHGGVYAWEEQHKFFTPIPVAVPRERGSRLIVRVVDIGISSGLF